jgi:hypothetical protein
MLQATIDENAKQEEHRKWQETQANMVDVVGPNGEPMGRIPVDKISGSGLQTPDMWRVKQQLTANTEEAQARREDRKLAREDMGAYREATAQDRRGAAENAGWIPYINSKTKQSGLYNRITSARQDVPADVQLAGATTDEQRTNEMFDTELKRGADSLLAPMAHLSPVDQAQGKGEIYPKRAAGYTLLGSELEQVYKNPETHNLARKTMAEAQLAMTNGKPFTNEAQVFDFGGRKFHAIRKWDDASGQFIEVGGKDVTTGEVYTPQQMQAMNSGGAK